MIKKLNELIPLQRGRIIRVRGIGPLRQRMMDMGLVPGAEIKVIRYAPLGDPVEYQIKGYNLSLREREAQHILVEVDMMPLSEIKPGQEVNIVDVFGGKHFIQRCKLMGIKPGLTLTVLRKFQEGPILVLVHEKELKIGQGMAHKIFVEQTNAAVTRGD